VLRTNSDQPRANSVLFTGGEHVLFTGARLKEAACFAALTITNMTTRNLWILIAVLIGLSIAVVLYMKSFCRTSAPSGAENLIQRNVRQFEHDCVTCDFRTYFIAKKDGVQVTLVPNVRIEIGSFLTALDRVLTIGYEDVGVIIHHGLREVNTDVFQYHPDIEFVGLKWIQADKWEIMPIPDQRFGIDLGTGALTTSNAPNGWSTYLAHMHRFIDNNSTAPTPVIEGKDVRFYLHRYKGAIEELLANNAPFNPTHIQVSSIAEPLSHQGNVMKTLRHYVSLALVDSNGRLLIDDEDYAPNDFKMKALDVGSPCPYRCATAELPKSGIPVRASCVKGGNPGC
jgi:hypothetical protein